MPPRKKAAVADASDASNPPAPRGTRSSTRIKAQASEAMAAPEPKASTAPKSKAKGKAKRTHDASDNEKEAKPKSKKAKASESEAGDDKATGDANASTAAPEKADDKPAKMVTVLKRGAAPVDPQSGYVNSHQVLVTSEGVWDATLNQTDVSKNANKFYVIQVLHPVGSTDQCILYTRWGRVGEYGQKQQKVGQGPFNAAGAVIAFKSQFRAKAGVAWENRHGTVASKGKYQWIERVFGDEEEDPKSDEAGPSKEKDEEKVPDSTLPVETQALCRLIFSAKLSEVISQPNGAAAQEYGGFRPAVEHLTGRYYSIIPHVFGRNRPTIIDNMLMLKRELDLVDSLGEMEIASKLITSSIPRNAQGEPVNPIDASFLSLRLSRMDPIARDSGEFTALEAYARDTHGESHRHYKVDIHHAFRVERQEETDAWIRAGHDDLPDGHRLLLWHGSRTTNFAGILSQGLRIAPPEGYMFGKGVYFADSAGYCHSYLSDNTGLLLLCEVAAKPFYEQYNANYDANVDCINAGKKCTKGLGRTQPGEWQDAGEALENDALKGCHMPKGKGKDTSDPQAGLFYNEIRVRYLLMLRMG
ncbi:PARP-domain-containing protein [Laetiporus sulphureus 93-53]|uniref:Poly [ADP-ribose] polymerase n=1 Tax=Laetiporus sulphureus 93-53 TaxID=1314785 RepID=A0A165FF89_9APHY|nr:PARP-domain-containing protein [Laetiporus sulphureus 93-53]KZT08880.1 PARP-domain-containing protein [Laetiporus sulphureus 93-53]